MNKLLKYVAALLTAAGMLLPYATAFAADSGQATIRVEGEEYQSASSEFRPKASEAFSNNTMVELYGNYSLDKVYQLKYNVTVPEAGSYNLYVSSSKVGVNFTCRYTVTVNDSEELDTLNAKHVRDVECPPYANTMAYYNLGEFAFKKGGNTVTFTISQRRELAGNPAHVFFLDYFEVGRDTSEKPVRSFAPSAELGVFTEGGSVSYDVEYGYMDGEAHKLKLCVTDYWGAEVINDEITVPAYARKKVLNLGRMENGWYSLKISDDYDNVLASSSFSVIPVSTVKKSDETPFGMDAALAWLVSSDKITPYANAIKAAGVNWIRDRFRWRELESTKGVYDFSKMDKVVDAQCKDLNILEVFHDVPNWSKPNGTTLSEDLFDIYNFAKEFGKHYDGKVSGLEIFNEVDSESYNLDTAEKYSAFTKAALIGLSDSGADMVKAPSSYSKYPPFITPFPDLVMQNGLMEYSDIYNYHNYSSYSGKELTATREAALRAHQTIPSAYGDTTAPRWMTEGGMFTPGNGKEPLDTDKSAAVARFLVTSQVQSLARGCDKVFWFVLPAYGENPNVFGLFDYNDNPYPSYTAEAVMTKMLGKGKYKGIVQKLPDGAYGYLFNSGTNDVAVLWSDKSVNAQFKSDQPLTVTDVMGGKKTYYPNKCGYVLVPVYYDPVYVTFSGTCGEENYYPQSYEERPMVKKTYSDAKHIVLKQNFASNIVEFRGNVLDAQNPNEVMVDVYNFNDRPMTGTVTGTIDGPITIETPVQNVTVEPMSKATVTFRLTVNQDAPLSGRSNLSFTGNFGGEDTTPSFLAVTFSKSVEPTKLIENASSTTAWDLTNIASGATAAVSRGAEAGEITFECTFADANLNKNWFYPFLKIQDNSVFNDTKGLTFSVKGEKDLPNYNMNVFLYYKDGTRFYVGSGFGVKEGWRQIFIPWEMFRLYGDANVENQTKVDLSRVTMMSIGINSGERSAKPYTLKNIGVYNMDGAVDITDRRLEKITLSGIEDGALVQSEGLQLTAQLPEETEIESVKVLVSEKEYTNFVRNGKTVTVDLSSLTTGAYQVLVVGYTKDGYAVRQDIDFMVK